MIGASAIAVLTAVHFDDESRRFAKEVHNVGTEWNLSPDLPTLESTRAKVVPELAFRIGHPMAKFARVPGGVIRTKS
jgi:NAD-specific glutamate dehydrogenase